MTWKQRAMSGALATVCFAATLHAPALEAQGASPLANGGRPYAWDISLALESTNDLHGALAVMLGTYGARPAQYVPCLRLAWLMLQLGDYDQAAVLYRRAALLDSAQGEAPLGLALALTRSGYRALARGSYGDARSSWEQALAVAPADASPNMHANAAATSDAREGLALVGRARALAPELWFGRSSATVGSTSSNLVYAQLPWRLNAWVTLRLAYRSESASDATTSTSGAPSFFGKQHEIFGGAIIDRGITTTSVAIFQLSNVLGANAGGALSVRVGGKNGAVLLGSVIQTSSGSNLQIAPDVYRWMSSRVRVSAGARFTTDSSWSGASARLGASLDVHRASLAVQAHAGKERWAFDMAGPTILSFLSPTTGGGTVTAAISVGAKTTLSAQLQAEHLESPTYGTGWYRGVAVGVRFVADNLTLPSQRR